MTIKIQVPKTHYTKEYDNLERFISYFYQIDFTKKLYPKKILEIGVGNKTVSNYLKNQGFNITTYDFDKKLKPDFVGDVRKMPFKNNSFDLVMCCEVLEHIPFSEFGRTLNEIRRISRKNAIISIPNSSKTIAVHIKFPGMFFLFHKPLLSFVFSIPFPTKHKFDGEHYWEIGKKNYALKKIKKRIKKYFKIKKNFRIPLNTYHQFFILEK